MKTENEDYLPRDIGTAIASSIGIFFISTIMYSGTLSTKDEIFSLRHNPWYDVQLTPAQSLNFHVTEFRTREIRLYIEQHQNQVYEQSCNGFRKTCKAFENNEIKMQAVNFYSNHYYFNPSSHLVLKSIEFIDQEQKPQTLIINPTLPSDPQYIQKQKHSFATSMILTCFIFTIFSIVFYANHLGRYFASKETLALLNKGIVFYYFFTLLFIVTQYFLM